MNGAVPELRRIAAAVASEATRSDTVLAVLLTGSVARGDGTPASDVDLIVVTRDDVGAVAMRRELRGGVLVETVAGSEKEWSVRLHRPVPRWLYALLEAEVLHDSGVGLRLVREAHEVLNCYRTPSAVLAEMAAALWHGQAKLDRALSSTEASVRGYQASLAVDWIIDALYAVYNVPLPAAARRLHYLSGVPLDRATRRDWQVLLTGGVDERLEANARLQAMLRERLPPPRLDVAY